jgi:hypothetical protein
MTAWAVRIIARWRTSRLILRPSALPRLGSRDRCRLPRPVGHVSRCDDSEQPQLRAVDRKPHSGDPTFGCGKSPTATAGVAVAPSYRRVRRWWRFAGARRNRLVPAARQHSTTARLPMAEAGLQTGTRSTQQAGSGRLVQDLGGGASSPCFTISFAVASATSLMSAGRLSGFVVRLWLAHSSLSRSSE